MQIFCENPTIIVNPNVNQLVYQYHNYVLDGEFHYVADVRHFAQGHKLKYFSPRRQGVTMDNIENFGVLTDNGLEPMFFAVPCGKCVLCRENKASEWSFRALCENQSSISQPLFVTLTFKPKYRHNDGIHKEDIQLFMKRLRRNLDKRGIEHNIRYFACGEYGKKSKVPHYHLILWNFPRENFGTITSCLHFVEDAWRIAVKDRLGRIQYNTDGSPITDSIGFAYCVNCEKGAISYVMKYMRKDCVIPQGCRPTFFLSSRKHGGIGALHFKQYIDFYRNNPDCLEFTVHDKFSGYSQTKTLPAYFRRMVYPSVSIVISKYDRDVYQQFINLIQKRAAFELPFEGVVASDSSLLFSDEKELIKIWSHVGISYDPDIVDTHFRHHLLRMTPEQREDCYYKLCEHIDYLLHYLQCVDINPDYFISRGTWLKKRRDFMEKNMQNNEQNLIEVKEQIIMRRKLAEYKEKI